MADDFDFLDGDDNDDEDRGDGVDDNKEQGDDVDDNEDRGDGVDDDIDPDILADIANEGKEKNKDTKPDHVPYDRFAEKVILANQLKIEKEVLQKELDELKGKKTDPEPEPKVDIKALRKEKNQAIYNGDIDLADELEEKIEVEIRRQAKEEALAEVTTTLSKRDQVTLEQNLTIELNIAAEVVAETYSFLDSTNKEMFDKQAAAAIMGLRDSYISQGLRWGEALEKAAGELGPIYAKAKGIDLENSDGGNDLQETPVQRKMRLEKEARIKAAKASTSQPPNISSKGSGSRSTEISGKEVTDMTDEEFDALPEKDKKKLRGD
jgi:hypothetical protein